MTERSGLHLLMRRGFRLRLTVAAVLAGGVGVVAWDVGLDTPHAVMLAVVVLCGGIVQSALPELDTPEFPAIGGTSAAGVRQDVLALSFSVNTRRARVQPAALARVRDLAAVRLDRHRLDLAATADHERIGAALGADVLAVLTSRDPDTVTPRDLDACLTALARLDEDTADTTPHPTAHLHRERSTATKETHG